MRRPQHPHGPVLAPQCGGRAARWWAVWAVPHRWAKDRGILLVWRSVVVPAVASLRPWTCTIPVPAVPERRLLWLPMPRFRGAGRKHAVTRISIRASAWAARRSFAAVASSRALGRGGPGAAGRRGTSAPGAGLVPAPTRPPSHTRHMAPMRTFGLLVRGRQVCLARVNPPRYRG